MCIDVLQNLVLVPCSYVVKSFAQLLGLHFDINPATKTAVESRQPILPLTEVNGSTALGWSVRRIQIAKLAHMSPWHSRCRTRMGRPTLRAGTLS
jgi:hypothetical protein